MFIELLPILRNRPLMLTLALVGDHAIRVNVIPKRTKDSDSGDDALTTPLTVTGAPEELDREFAGQLVGFAEAFVKLGSNLAEIEATHATAIKAIEAEKKKDIENRRKGSTSRPPSANADAKPEPLAKDGKPVFGTKTDTAETPGLFDSHGTEAASEESPQEHATSPSEAGGCSISAGDRGTCRDIEFPNTREAGSRGALVTTGRAKVGDGVHTSKWTAGGSWLT
jgi:PRTRC genetic system protein E